MKNYVVGMAVLSTVVLLAGCGSKELTPVEFCEENGWVFSEDVCLFEDGSYCETESFANEECKMGEKVYSVDDETSVVEYCVDKGGEVRAEEDASLCMFSDGSYCEVEAYFNGECREGEMMYNVGEEEVELVDELENTEESVEPVADEVVELEVEELSE